MTDIAKALHSFFNNIMPAYIEGNVPKKDLENKKIEPPYMTYPVVNSNFSEETLAQARIWTKEEESILELTEYCNLLSEAIPTQGTVLNLDNNKGAIWLQRGIPWIQNTPLPEEDIMFKSAIANIVYRSLKI